MDTNQPGNAGENQTGIDDTTQTGGQDPNAIAGDTGGQPSSQDDAAKLKEENERLKGNLAAIQRREYLNRRSIGGQGQPQPGQGQPGGQTFGNIDDSTAQQIAVAYEVADGQLRRELEPILALYPELDASDLSRIRTNPWAFTSRQSFMTGDVASALYEIEQMIAKQVEDKASTTASPGGGKGKAINPNPAPTPQPKKAAVPGTT